MIEDGPDASEELHAGPGPYPQHFEQQQQQAFTSNQHGVPITMTADGVSQSDAQPGFGQMFDPTDPMLDADPFGLTASMHFPTPFSFQQSSMRK